MDARPCSASSKPGSRTVFRRVCPSSNSILDQSGYSPNTGFWESAHFASPSRGPNTQLSRELKMKKLVLALTALAAFTGSAVAADLPARTYTKAPEPLPVAPSWTGFYIFGGGGGGIWDANTSVIATGSGLPILPINQQQGGN